MNVLSALYSLSLVPLISILVLYELFIDVFMYKTDLSVSYLIIYLFLELCISKASSLLHMAALMSNYFYALNFDEVRQHCLQFFYTVYAIFFI